MKVTFSSKYTYPFLILPENNKNQFIMNLCHKNLLESIHTSAISLFFEKEKRKIGVINGSFFSFFKNNILI